MLAAAQPSSACNLTGTNSKFIDELFCTRQQYDQQVFQTGIEGLRTALLLYLKFFFGFFGPMAVSGIAEAASLQPFGTKVLQATWSVLVSNVSAIAVRAKIPSLKDTLAGAARQFIEQPWRTRLSLVSSGLGVWQAASKLLARKNAVIVEAATNPQQGGAGTVILVQSSGKTSYLEVPGGQTTMQIKPNPLSAFNGLYTGSYSGSTTFCCDANGNQVTQGVGGPVALTISNGKIAVTQPGAGGGTVTLQNSTVAFASGGVAGGGVSCGFGGGLVISPSGAASIGGGFNCTFAQGSASGSWGARR